ncbi:hypothetical protein FCK90_02815 [Kocuria coralli]|uniref:Cell wall-binding repeat-containing protein n=1 Tax=Kocuria coralli TaxID=1461025 RepID=A0A5J5L137_9MICC|nr:hypothetical protein [Kocuria coralli]KAA9395350.1 hypothetical protein FCK90_02815 [Kocuria coralli]
MTRPLTRPLTPRTLKTGALTAATAAVAVALTSCSSGTTTGPQLAFTDEAAATAVVDDPTAASVAASEAAFTRAEAVFLSPPEQSEELAEASAEARMPLLLTGDDDALREELDRLGTETVIVAQDAPAPAAAGEREVIEVDPEARADAMGLPDLDADDDDAPAVAMIDPGEHHPAAAAVAATVRAAGGEVVEVPGGDPRVSGDSVAAAERSPDTSVVAVGASFGSTDQLEERMSLAASTTAELPGGGQLAFPGRRMVALYGSPGTAALGALGEQDVDAAIQRASELAEQYEPHSEEPVIPAFEIIATIASSEPGPDGDYTSEIDPEQLRPWVEAAQDEGVYVVLDLQPGQVDFLTQAQRYEDLLKEPNVGLALDPEWRLQEGQRHMEQIGSVDAAEINEVSGWLAELTARNHLPQKTLILHQFSTAMITDRESIDTSHEELAITLHADGHGTPQLKTETWDVLRQDLPEGIWMAWKNFYDEDTPVFTPEQTYDVDPRPWFVSYQ